MRFKIILYIVLPCLLITCKYSEKVIDGRSAYDLKQYAVAAEYFAKDYASSRRVEDKAHFAYRTASCYESINDVKESLSWYRKAVDHDYGPEAYEGYAYALKANEKFTEASQVFNYLNSEYGTQPKYQDEIAKCRQASRWINESGKFITTIKPLSINSVASEYSPTVINANQLLFTSDRKESQGDETYLWTGNEFSDVYLYDMLSGEVNTFKGPINTVHNDGAAVMTSTGEEIFFTRCFDPESDHYCKIYSSRKNGDKWTSPEPLSFQKDAINYGHPVFYKHDSLLIYSANDPAGFGGYDLFASIRDINGWSDPFILDDKVNTEGNEKFPTVHEDTLYFSSDRITGMGGLDIFKTYMLKGGAWNRAVNLQSPINSGADDFGLTVDPYKSQNKGIIEAGYFSSSRNTGMGRDDIYAYTMTKNTDKINLSDEEADPDDDLNYQYYLAGFVYERILEDPSNPLSPVIGQVKLANANVEIEYQDELIVVKTDQSGRFVQKIDKGYLYLISAKKKDYLKNSVTYSTIDVVDNPLKPVVTFNVKLSLDKIVRGKEITLDNIYYDFDKAYIREDAMPTLDGLAQILAYNPEINIRLGSHTDCQGAADYNTELSQRRADSAVAYLISKGIAPDRMQSKGYGETRLRVNCVCESCTDDEHQINRRTTFEILE